jgi:hypothetical protein
MKLSPAKAGSASSAGSRSASTTASRTPRPRRRGRLRGKPAAGPLRPRTMGASAAGARLTSGAVDALSCGGGQGTLMRPGSRKSGAGEAPGTGRNSRQVQPPAQRRYGWWATQQPSPSPLTSCAPSPQLRAQRGEELAPGRHAPALGCSAAGGGFDDVLIVCSLSARGREARREESPDVRWIARAVWRFVSLPARPGGGLVDLEPRGRRRDVSGGKVGPQAGRPGHHTTPVESTAHLCRPQPHSHTAHRRRRAVHLSSVAGAPPGRRPWPCWAGAPQPPAGARSGYR